MERTEYLEVIRAALAKAVNRKHDISEATHLIDEDLLDSLDSAVFLLEVERATTSKLPEVDIETKNLFQVKNLVDYLMA